MKKMVLAATVVAGLTLAAGAVAAQPYGYGGYGYDRGYNGYVRDSDRDGIPDHREWNRDRDRDGRPDQFDRYDNRRDRYGRYDRRYDRRGHYRAGPRYGYGYVQPYAPYRGDYRRY